MDLMEHDEATVTGPLTPSQARRPGPPMPALVRVAQALCARPDLLEQLLPGDAGSVLRALGEAGLASSGGGRWPAGDLPHSALPAGQALLAHRSGAPGTVVADHLLGAGPVDEPWVVPVLEDAARQALRDGRVEVAVDYLRAAGNSCTDEPRRARITAALLRAEWRINPGTAVGCLPQLSAALRDGQLRTADALVLTRALLWHGRFAEAREAFQQLAGERRPSVQSWAATAGDADDQAELAVAVPMMRATYPALLPLVPGRAYRSATVATVAGAQRLEAANALVAALKNGLTEHRASTAERILRTTRLDETSLDTVESALLALTYGGRPDRAAPWCDRFVAEAGERGAPSRQARLAAVRAEIAIRLGDLPAACEHGRRALAIMPPSSWGVAVGGPLATLVMAYAATGDHGAVRDLLDQPVPAELFQTRYGLHYLYARARYSRAVGEFPLALRDLERCGRLTARWQLDVPGFLPWRVDAAETLLALKRPEEARALVEDQLARSGVDSPRVRAMALRLHAVGRPPRERLTMLRRAAELLAGGDAYELARTLMDSATAYRESGEPRRAAMTARRARAVAEKAGARSLLGDEAPEAPAIGIGTLSESERRVVALAVDGYTNREIARKLFVTVSTVEQHLTHAYRKLNVTRRTDLPAVV